MFNSFGEDFARESAVMTATHEAKMLKLEALFEATELNYQSNCAMARAKVLTEYGTKNDLLTLYKEASNEAAEKKANIFKRMVEAVKEMFRKIKDFIDEKILSRFTTKEELNEEVEVPKNITKVIDALKKAYAFIETNAKKVLSNVKNAISEKTKDDWIKIIAIGSAVVVGAGTMYVKRETIKGWCKNIQTSVIDKSHDLANKFNDSKFGSALNAEAENHLHPVKVASGKETQTMIDKSATDGTYSKVTTTVSADLYADAKTILSWLEALGALARKWITSLVSAKKKEETTQESAESFDETSELNAFFEATEQELNLLDIM